MLTKAFELKHEFPFGINNGKIRIDKETLIPAGWSPIANVEKYKYMVISPSFNNPVIFYGITTNSKGLRIVTVSDGLRTYFYWFTNRKRYHLKVSAGSRDLEEAWLNLFKFVVSNPVPKVLEMWGILKVFCKGYLAHLGEKELYINVSAKYDNELYYVEIVKEPYMSKAVFVIVNDKRKLVNLFDHPLLGFLNDN